MRVLVDRITSHFPVVKQAQAGQRNRAEAKTGVIPQESEK